LLFKYLLVLIGAVIDSVWGVTLLKESSW